MKRLLVFLLAIIALSSCSAPKQIQPLDEDLVFEDSEDALLDDIDFGVAEDEGGEFDISDSDLDLSLEEGSGSDDDLDFSDFDAESTGDSTSDSVASGEGDLDFSEFEEDSVGEDFNFEESPASDDAFSFEDSIDENPNFENEGSDEEFSFDEFEDVSTPDDAVALGESTDGGEELSFDDFSDDSATDFGGFDTPVVAETPVAPVAPSTGAEFDFSDSTPVTSENDGFSDDSDFGSNSGFSSTEVVNIDYNAHQNGGVFVIETTSTPSYTTELIPETNQYVLKIENASMSRSLARPFLTKDFRQSFEAMNSYRGDNGDVRLVFQLKPNSSPSVSMRGGKLVVEPGVSSSSLALKNTGLGETDDKLSLSATSFEDFLLDKTEYVGKPISLQVRDTDVVSVIQFISEEVGANVALSSSVQGKISIKFKNVPWDQALVTIMKVKSLGYVRSGNILRIAPLKELRDESKAAAEIQQAKKELAPFHVKVFPLSYASPDELVAKITPFLTQSINGDATRAGRAMSEIRSSSLIIRDTAEVIQSVAALIKELDRPPLQVMISAKIVEASKEFTRTIQGQSFSANPGTSVTGGDFRVDGNFRYALDPQSGSGSFFPAVSVGGIDFFGTLTAQLRLQEVDAKLKVLSSPSVMAINNEKAKIVQIDEILNTITSQQQGTIITAVERSPLELSLNVTPQVSADSNVIMDIEVKREFPQREAIGVGRSTRSAQSKVIVGNNKTAMIGGIYQVTDQKSVSGTPVLRKIPLLGWLFKEDFKTKRDTELIIFVTPRVMNSSSVGDQFADQKLRPSPNSTVSKY